MIQVFHSICSDVFVCLMLLLIFYILVVLILFYCLTVIISLCYRFISSQSVSPPQLLIRPLSPASHLAQVSPLCSSAAAHIYSLLQVLVSLALCVHNANPGSPPLFQCNAIWISSITVSQWCHARLLFFFISLCFPLMLLELCLHSCVQPQCSTVWLFKISTIWLNLNTIMNERMPDKSLSLL